MKKIMILILAGLMAAPLLWAAKKASPEQASEQAGEVIEILWEERFDEPVVDVIYGMEDITVAEAKKLNISGLEKRKSKEKVKIKYPKVAFIKAPKAPGRPSHVADEVRFLDKSGKTKRTLQKDFGINMRDISKNKKYISFTRTFKDDKRTGEIIYETRIFDTEGSFQMNIEHPNLGVRISPCGEYIIATDTKYNDVIAVYNKNGIVKKVEKAGAYSVDFAYDGSWFAVIARHGEVAGDDLIVCGKDGNEIWRKKTTSQALGAGKVKISEDGKITVMTGVSEYRVYIFDEQGEMLEERQGTLKELRGFRN